MSECKKCKRPLNNSSTDCGCSDKRYKISGIIGNPLGVIKTGFGATDDDMIWALELLIEHIQSFAGESK